jgi:hypothetical protein
LGQLTPDEQAQIQSAQQEAQITRKFDPINQAVKAISQDRITTARGGTMDDQKFESLRAKQLQGQPLSSDESAFLQSYRERKTLGPVASAQLSQPNKDTAPG